MSGLSVEIPVEVTMTCYHMPVMRTEVELALAALDTLLQQGATVTDDHVSIYCRSLAVWPDIRGKFHVLDNAVRAYLQT